MLKIILYSGVFFSVLLIFNCNSKCENVEVGSTSLSDMSLSFFGYSDNQFVEFQNEKGQIKAFAVRNNEGHYFICQNVTCNPLDPYKSSFCEYIDAPIMECFLNSDSILLAIEASVFAYKPETQLFYDAVRFTVSHEHNSLTASYITDVKFDLETFDQDDISDIDKFLLYNKELMIDNVLFSNVLYLEETDLSLYYQIGEGFLAFKLGDELWIRK